ncbi:hypothetical protein Lal_00043673 [Lupinus albus]|nr:hypothetical protein Lal_00043673 [Lupinus albus]
MNENLQHLNQNATPSPSSQPLVPPCPAEYRGFGEFCRRNPSPFHGGFAPDVAIEWIQRLERIFKGMSCSDAQMLAEKFFRKYFPADMRSQKEMEFLRSKCSKFESGLKPKLKTMLRHQEITDFSTLVNKCRMVEDDIKADEVMASRSLPPKNFGPQRNVVHGNGKGKASPEERKRYSSPMGNRGYTPHGPRTHANTGGSQQNPQPWCNKCGRKHFGDSCPRTTLSCFFYKESEICICHTSSYDIRKQSYAKNRF